jgi:PQQ-dependent catabolism-associated CXXCW motif protein
LATFTEVKTMQFLSKAFALFLALYSTALVAKSAPAFPPGLAAEAKQGYQDQYLKSAEHKAFVVGANGRAYTAVFGFPTPHDAARAASSRCLAEHRVICQLWLVNGDDLWPRYLASEQASRAAIKQMRALPASVADEDAASKDALSAPSAPSGLRAGAEMHGLTPLQAPAKAKRVGTAELRRLYATEPKLLVLDVLHSKSLTRKTLPNARWLYGAGWEDASLNPTIDQQLSLAMGALAPNRKVPVVVYCSNVDCWLSWNAAWRLVQLGYTKVYWYRGGTDAWGKAGLPFVETPLSAHLW